MRGIRNRVCSVCPFPWYTECATPENRETQEIALLPLLG